MKLFGIRLFKSRRDVKLEEANLAVLRGLMEAQRGNATPQETLAALMRHGDSELRPNERPEPTVAASQAVVSPPPLAAEEPFPSADASEPVAALPEPEESGVAPLAELDTARLVELLGSDDDGSPEKP
jgi:hypothetical protein